MAKVNPQLSTMRGPERVPSASFRARRKNRFAAVAERRARRDNIKIGVRAQANASWRIFLSGAGEARRGIREHRRRANSKASLAAQHLGATSQTHITHIIQQQMHECGGEQENYCWPSSGMFISLLIFSAARGRQVTFITRVAPVHINVRRLGRTTRLIYF